MTMQKIKERDKEIIISLSKNPKIRKHIGKIVNYFDDLQYFWQNPNLLDFQKAEMGEEAYNNFLDLKHNTIPERELEFLKKEDINTIFINDKNYPDLLKEIFDPPIVLYVRGNINIENRLKLSIVGTRRPTNYGIESALNIAEHIAKSDFVIVSGLAIGIDTLAHRGSLNGGGMTVAVLGTSVDDKSIYPSINRSLVLKIIESGGAVISEYPLGYPIFKHNFPERNRIISGLSHGTLVVEAKKRSGALITANFALEQGREVFAVPGDINRLESEGPNSLIKMGAKIVMHYSDILNEFGIEEINKEEIKADSELEMKIIEVIKNESLHIDKIVELTGLSISEVSSTLSLMEIKGKVINLGAINFVIKK